MPKDVLVNSNKTYLFSRLLVSSELGAVGRSSKIKEIGNLLEDLVQEAQKDNIPAQVLRTQVTEILTRNARSPESLEKRRLLSQNICSKIESLSDVRFLSLTCRMIMPSLNKMVDKAPKSADVNIAEEISELKALGVPSYGAQALALNNLEQKEIDACLEEERQAVILYSDRIMKELEGESWMTSNDRMVIITGFIQEAERRIGQKRKSRSGKSIKSAIATILVMNQIKACQAPEVAPCLLDVEFWVSNDTGKTGILASHNFRNTVQAYLKQPGKEKHNLIHVLVNKRDLKPNMIGSVINQGHSVVVPDQHYDHLAKSVGTTRLIKMRKFISDVLPTFDKIELSEKLELIGDDAPTVDSALPEKVEVEVDEALPNQTNFDELLPDPFSNWDDKLIGYAKTSKTNDKGESLLAYVYDANHMSPPEIGRLLKFTGSRNILVHSTDTEDELLEQMNQQCIMFPSYKAVGVGYSLEKMGCVVYDTDSMIEQLEEMSECSEEEAKQLFETTIEPSSLSEFGPCFILP
ncbi:hypothetical protein [Vibrio harveyi]|uniref:hypothetical protein n=1 Tax=Vibrio harveyi TaxID=669 RepID=UPI003CF5B308